MPANLLARRCGGACLSPPFVVFAVQIDGMKSALLLAYYFRIHGGAAVSLGGMVGRSALMQSVFTAIQRFGPHGTTVLIQGESGTGKELVARALHTYSRTPRGPFITFNCSNLVESLAESLRPPRSSLQAPETAPGEHL